jgi:hypothetical protein
MLRLRLEDTLNFTQESEWKQLAASTLGLEVHPNRRQGFLLSRQALQKAFLDFGITVEVLHLQLDHYDALKNFPDYTLSLAHTSLWGAALVGEKKKFVSVGIDIEPLKRIVKDPILQRISHPEDLKLEPIVHWALKEATFKTIMNTRGFDQNPEFSSILLGDKVWSHSSGLAGKWDLEFTSELVVAKAWMEV